MAANYLGDLPGHGRFGYGAIPRRPGCRWPGGAGLAVYVAVNHEQFVFGEGLGATIGPASPQPDMLNYSWREYGNRVGASLHRRPALQAAAPAAGAAPHRRGT